MGRDSLQRLRALSSSESSQSLSNGNDVYFFYLSVYGDFQIRNKERESACTGWLKVSIKHY